MPRYQRSEATDAMVRYLIPHPKGAQVSYDELSQVAGEPASARSPKVRSARGIMLREHAAVWACVAPNVGLVRLDDIEMAERQRSWYLPRARSGLRRGAGEAKVVETERLSIDQQARFATDSIIRELARDALSRTTQRRVERVARGTSNDLPSFNAVEWAIALTPRR
jgi:hypothetical protein